MNTTIKPQAIMLIGVPGSGKSTWAEPFLLRDFELISSDVYIERFAKALGKKYGETFEETIGVATKWMEKQLNLTLAAHRQLIWDQTNLSIKSRRPKLDKLLTAGYEVIAVTFEVPTDELEKRRLAREEKTGKTIAPSVLESMGKTYVRPTRLEGFSKVIIVTPDREYESDI